MPSPYYICEYVPTRNVWTLSRIDPPRAGVAQPPVVVGTYASETELAEAWTQRVAPLCPNDTLAR